MSFDAGSAHGKYLLDISDAEAKVKRLEALFSGLARQTSTVGGAGPARQSTQANQAAERAILARAAAEARLATAAARQATQEQKLATEIARTAAAQDRAAQSALRRSQAEARAQRQSENGGLGPALPRTFAGFAGTGLTQLAGAYFGPQIIGSIAKYTVESGKAALELDRTLRVTKELSGTQATYNSVIEAARQQQQRYGGSLQENVAGIQGLVVTARSTGAELQTLINLSQRLAVLDPAQGTEGARIALQEVLSGDPRSLSRRYEIPLSALQKIKDESVPVADRLAVLDAYLNKIGITSKVVDTAVSAQARAYNDLTTAADNLQTSIGGVVSKAFVPLAQNLTGILGGGFLKDTKTGFVDGAIGVQNLLRSLQGLPPISAQAQQSQRDLADSTFRGAQAFAAAIGLSNLFTTATEQRTQAILRAADAEDRAAEARRGSLIAQQATTAATIVEVANKQALEAQGKLLEGQIKLQAEAYLALNPNIDAAGVASAVAANKIDKAVGDYINMTIAIQNARNQLAALQNQAGLAAGATEGRGERDRPGDRAAAAAAGAEAARQRAADLEQAKRDQILQTGSTRQKIAERERAYAEAVAKYGKNSAEATKAETDLIREKQSASAAYGRGLNQQLNTQERIYDSLAKQRDAMLDIEELTIRDRQQDREDAVKRRTAERILASPNASADAKARAADALALIDVQDRKRAAEIANKSATAGASIINGKLYQSVGGGAASGAAPTGAAGGASPAPAQAGAAGGGNVVTLRLVDSAGRVLADSVGPIIMDQLLAAAGAVALQRGL